MHLGHTVNRLFIGAKIGVWYLEYFLFRPVATPALPKIIEIQVMSYLLVFLCSSVLNKIICNMYKI